MNATNSIRDTFFEECDELLEALVDGISDMESGDATDETINAIFRAVHSIKGGAGAFGLDALVEFSHRFETVLDRIRSNDLPMDEELLGVLQRSGDHLSGLVEDARENRESDTNDTSGILAALGNYLADGGESPEPPAEEFSFEPMILAVDLPEPTAQSFTIDFAPHEALYRNGHDPELLFIALADLGTCTIKTDLEAIPLIPDMRWNEPYLAWNIELETDKSLEDIQTVFEFVEGLCDLTITLSGTPSDTQSGDDDVVQIDPVETPEDPAPVMEQPDPSPAAEAPAPPEPTKKKSNPAKSAARATLRVDLERVDKLVNTVGELIINQAMITQLIEDSDFASGSPVMAELESYQQLAREIQEGVMSIRAQPVKPLFQRLSRIVREVMDATGKKVRLKTLGEGTEVDKTVIERLADPLTHMIRNAVDHGIEMPEVRAEKGKDEYGEIILSASHRSGRVMISIADNGAGLNRKKILEIATEKGLVPPDASLSDSEIDNLLFLPGFSTASEVSNLSGRGVGMDVVKNAISALGGRILISSEPNVGSTFSITLPLTLAVLDGMVVSVSGETMVVPIATILETIRPTEADLNPLGESVWMLSIRGRNVPIYDVADGLGLRKEPIDLKSQVLLLVETEGQGQFALAVDDIHDQRQVVIKGLDANYGEIAGISAATILGDGKIALILDPDTLTASRKKPAPVIAADPEIKEIEDATIG